MEGCIKGDIFQNSGRGFFKEKNQCISLYSTYKNTLQLENHFGPFLIF